MIFTRGLPIPDEFSTLELSNTLRCHGTWLSFRIQLVVVALSRNPLPEVGRVLLWSEAVTELCLEFTHLFKTFVPISSTWVISSEGMALDGIIYLLRCQTVRLPSESTWPF